MLNHRCAKLSMRSVPASIKEYQFNPIAMYDISNYKQIISRCITKIQIEDVSAHFAVKEIVEYICNPNFDENTHISYKVGIVFFFNGFPLLGFKHNINSLITLKNDQILLIDINNYLFNKELILKTDSKERMIKRYNDFKDIFHIIIFYMLFIYLLRIYQLFLEE